MLVPTRSIFSTDDDVAVELVGTEGTGTLRITHLGELVTEVPRVGAGTHPLGRMARGGYGLEWRNGQQSLRTALDVQHDPGARHRYGFVAAYQPDRDTAAFSLALRRLHLTDVQFYDWAYRHADLLGGGHEYSDALGRPISVDTVIRLVEAAHVAGSRALGYAAVYGVGNDEWSQWRDGALLDAAGEPYSLGTFLQIVDPAWSPWLEHFVGDLTRAVNEIGFDGFHLDQYGYPKIARRADGVLIDIVRSFVSVIEAARLALPSARLVFNNVNDFDTRVTSDSDQDVIYIEPWAPTTTLDDLGALALRARDAARGRPVILAAYQSVYKSASVEEADRATALTMATLFSHGATQLLAGEDDRILVDPYYVKNQQMAESTFEMLRAYLDFLVEHDELLLNPALDDVTASVAGSYNDDCDVTFDGARTANSAEPGSIWRRITRQGNQLVVHLINLTDQVDVQWDGPKRPLQPTPSGQLRVRAVLDSPVRIRVAEPLVSPTLTDLSVHADGTHAGATLPPVTLWQVVVIDLA